MIWVKTAQLEGAGTSTFRIEALITHWNIESVEYQAPQTFRLKNKNFSEIKRRPGFEAIGHCPMFAQTFFV
jgi:hypothetical protein